MFGHLDPRGRKIEYLSLFDARGRNPGEISRAVQTRHYPMQHDMVRIVDLT
jgi:hypothetical protein